jgi:hypothetical protein
VAGVIFYRVTTLVSGQRPLNGGLAISFASEYIMEEMSTVSIQVRGRYYSCREAAALLDLDPDTVRTYCNSDPPRLVAEKVGRDWLIPKAEIDRYQRERRDPGRPPTTD